MDARALQELHVQREILDQSPYNQPMSKLVKAFKLVEQGKVTAWGPGVWQVEGSQPTPYRVTKDGCACKAGEHSHKTRFACAHAVAAELFDRWQRALQPMLALPLGPSTPDEHLASKPHDGAQATISPHDDLLDMLTPKPILEPARGLKNDSDTTQEPAMPTPQTDESLPEPPPAPAEGALPQTAYVRHMPLPPTPAPAGGTPAAPEPAPPAYVAHDRIERSPQIAHLMVALARAQAQMANPAFDSTNPHFKSRYASLAAVRDTITPALTAQEIALTQLISAEDGAVLCTTGLWHSSGEYLCSTLRLPVPKADPQGYGVAITYARRYALMAVCNVAGDEDDAAESLRKEGQSKPGSASQKPVTPDNPVLRQEIAKALQQLGFQGKTKAEYEAEVLRRTGLALVPDHFGQVLEKLKTAVDTQAA